MDKNILASCFYWNTLAHHDALLVYIIRVQYLKKVRVRFTEELVASSDVKSGTANNAELAG